MELDADEQQAECGIRRALVGQGSRRRGLVAAEGQHLDIGVWTPRRLALLRFSTCRRRGHDDGGPGEVG
ncbi:hypothetical protein BM1_06479 [Bipolaris maydis]|nr:hypothetical protein BM1_06479 [Bipolaris maydis]